VPCDLVFCSWALGQYVRGERSMAFGVGAGRSNASDLLYLNKLDEALYN